MDAVKTYKKVNREDEKMTFGISRMEDIYEKHQGKPDEPHRHDFFTLIFAEKAKGTHYIDFHRYDLTSNQMYFISPGQVHQIIEDEKSYGYAVVFSSDFLIQSNIPLAFIEDLNLFNDFSENPPLEITKEAHGTIKRYLEDMLDFYHSDVTFKLEAIGSLLKLVLVLSNTMCDIKPVISDASDHVMRHFKRLINEHYKEWHNTTVYADVLNITPDHLNKVIKFRSGKSAKAHIQSRITVAAKRLLYFTDLSSKEIGFELGFSEPANFSAFFKTCTGVSPSKFREKS